MVMLIDTNKCPGAKSVPVIEIERLSVFHPKLIFYVAMPAENEVILSSGHLRNSLSKFLSNGLFVESFLALLA